MSAKDRPILIVIGNYKNGGIAKRATVIANGFSDIGRKVTIVVTKSGEVQPFFDLKENVKIVTVCNGVSDPKVNDLLAIKILKIYSRILPHKSKSRKLLAYEVAKRRETLALRSIFKKYKRPIIISLGLEYAVKSFFAAKGISKDICYATKTHAQGELVGLNQETVSEVMKNFSCVVCQTQYTAQFFEKLGIQKLEVIGNPLDIEDFGCVGDRKASIVNFCRISPEKRLDLLIYAFADFHKQYPQYRVDIYGNIVYPSEEEYKKELLNLIRGLALEEYVAIHPARKDIHETVKDAAMFVTTSDFEGLSNSMIEAMALGLPCICTDCNGGGAREYIENGINGLLIPKGDKDALVEAMKKFTDKDFASTCGKNASKIRERLDINYIVSQWQTVIDKYCR